MATSDTPADAVSSPPVARPITAAAVGGGTPDDRSAPLHPSEVDETLGSEYRALERRARINLAHWAIVAASLLLTASAWYFSRDFVQERAANRFEREVDRAVGLLQERMTRYEDLLRSGAALVRSSEGRVSHAEWRKFVDSLDIEERHPGVNAVSLVSAVRDADVDRFVARQRRWMPDYRIHPPVDSLLHMPLTYIEPLEPYVAALGLDLMHEAGRRRAILAARDTGDMRLSEPLSLVGQEGRAGFHLLSPWFAGAPASIKARRANFGGLVSVTFMVDELIQGALARDLRHVALRISDGEAMVHDEQDAAAPLHDPDPLMSTTVTLPLHGRDWSVQVQTDLDFRAQAGMNAPWMVLAGGLCVDLALLLVFSAMSAANRRALAFAARSEEASRDHLALLQRSNRELESFAHVVSHDLKTPLRGIGTLVEYLEEDLEPVLDTHDAPGDIAHNLQRLHTQQRRMTELVDGILDYSALGREQVAIQSLDTGSALRAVAADLGLDENRLIVRGPEPVFDTQSVRFRQVMHNLIGNAVKHHEDPVALRIEVDIARVLGGWSFAVRDNGPGIDARYHRSVFEVFRKLRSKDEVEGSGVGLSIVQRSVEIVGGHVQLESAPGEGACFTIFWPDDEANGQERDDIAPLAQAA